MYGPIMVNAVCYDLILKLYLTMDDQPFSVLGGGYFLFISRRHIVQQCNAAC